VLSYVASSVLSIVNLLKVCGYKSSRCHSCAGSTSRLWKFPVVHDHGIAVLEDSYSEVVVNVSIDLALNWQFFSDVVRSRSFVNMMSTNSTLDPVSTVLCRMLL